MSPVRPRRRRRSRFQPFEELRLAMVLDLGAEGLDRERLVEAWLVLGPRLLADRPVTPAGPDGFWRFADGVPDGLRDSGPVLYPVEDAEQVERERAEVENRRAAWLAKQKG